MGAGIDIKRVKVGKTSYPVLFSQRAWIDFYDISGGETIASFKATPKQISELFYCTAKAGARAEKQEFNYDYEAFLDLTDNYHIDVTINFLAAYADYYKNTEKAEPGKK
jgi:hypothetical protein